MSNYLFKNPFIVIFVVLTVLLQLTLWSGKTGLISLHKIKTEIRDTAKQGNEIVAQTQKIKQQVLHLNTYPEATEGLARKNFSFVKPGEKFATFKNPPTSINSDTAK